MEPTSYACLALRGSKEVSAVARTRLQLAEEMLYDRMCAGGGWNAGNPTDYGVVGSPEFGPTTWALMALRGEAERRENLESLEWIEQNWARVNTPSALALAAIGLQAYGRENTRVLEALRSRWDDEKISWTVPAMAWTVLALSGDLKWLPDANSAGKN